MGQNSLKLPLKVQSPLSAIPSACKLCGSGGPLVKVHFVLRAFALAVKGDSKHLLSVTNLARPVQLTQDGLWDNQMLCVSCEGSFC